MSETKIPKRYIGQLDDNNIEAGAGIQTSKLADGAEFVQRDGSVAFTGNQSMGNNKLTNVGTPAAGSNDAARIVDVENAVAGLSSLYKYRNVRVASTANVTISNPGTSSFDGVTLSAGDRILLKNQTAQAENGIYVFNGSGSAMTRATDADAWNEFPGTLVSVSEGTTQADTRWYCPVDDGGTLDTTAITYSQDSNAGLSNANFVDNETPSGTVNGVNTTFTLANTPVAGSVKLYLNGVRLTSGAGNDYTISGTSITMTTAPLTGEALKADYRK